MKLYIFSEDRTFVCKPFESAFTSADGKKYEGKITAASVMISAFYTKKKTHEPIYSYSDDDKSEDSLARRYFTATVDPVFGAVIIPQNNMELIEDLNDNNLDIACKISGYSIDYEVSYGFSDVINVTEDEFVRVVTENYDRFNSPTNYSGQCTTYSAKEVKKTYPRICSKIGYNKDGEVVAIPYESDERLEQFYSTAESEEEVRERMKELEGISLDQFKKVYNDYFWNNHKEHGTFKDTLAACKN